MWQVVVDLEGEGPVTLVAVAPDPNGFDLLSEPVVITLAPPVQPNTGGVRTADPRQTGRAFTALLALLLSAGGFSIYIAGRLIYMVARDRAKPR
jgi:hypothetical protein